MPWRVSTPVLLFVMSRSIVLLLLVTSASAAELPKAELLDLAGRVHVLFEARCKECHRPDKKKPGGGFGYVMDLKRVAENPDYIVKGVPPKSEIMRLVREGEMPPSDQTKFPRLTLDEVNDVRRWIAAGAPHEMLPKLNKTQAAPDPSVLSAEAYAVKERCKTKRVTLDLKGVPMATILTEMEKQSGIKVLYLKPKTEPVLSMKVTNHTLLEALEYLVLLGNFSLRFSVEGPLVGANPP
jgi:mono/diheme cytochrome c family protein